MFTTIEQVKELTGHEVSQELIIQAQGIIEAFVGRVEAEVSNAADLMRLGMATAYQAAYMNATPGMVFEQVQVLQTMQYGNMMTFQSNGLAPYIAPLAIIACNKLSWKRIRSVKTGSIYDAPVAPEGWKYE